MPHGGPCSSVPPTTRFHVHIDLDIGLGSSAVANESVYVPIGSSRPLVILAHTVNPPTPATHPSGDRVLRHFFTPIPTETPPELNTTSHCVCVFQSVCPSIHLEARASCVSPSAPYIKLDKQTTNKQVLHHTTTGVCPVRQHVLQQQQSQPQ